MEAALPRSSVKRRPNGFARIIKTKPKELIVTMGILTLTASMIIFGNSAQMFTSFGAYALFAPIFQILVPLVIWVAAEIKIKKQKQTQIDKLLTGAAGSP